MPEDGVTPSKDHGNKNAPLPDWENIWAIILISLLGFIVSNWLFFVTLSDIRGYIEDHNIEFPLVEYWAILFFLIAFYIIPKLILTTYNRLFPQKKCNDSKVYNIIGILITALFISIILICFFPWFAPMEGAERDFLWQTVFLWLVSIFIINILFNSNGFQEISVEFIKRIRFHDRLIEFIKKIKFNKIFGRRANE
jgi:hypothetical protein